MSDFDCKLCIGSEHLTIITGLATTISITISYMLIYVFFSYCIILYFFLFQTPLM